MSEVLLDLSAKICDGIDELKECFNGPVRIAVIIKSDRPDSDIYVGDATPEDIRAVLDNLGSMDLLGGPRPFGE